MNVYSKASFIRSNFLLKTYTDRMQKIACPYCLGDSTENTKRFRAVSHELGADTHYIHFCTKCRKQFIVVERRLWVPVHVYEITQEDNHEVYMSNEYRKPMTEADTVRMEFKLYPSSGKLLPICTEGKELDKSMENLRNQESNREWCKRQTKSQM